VIDLDDQVAAKKATVDEVRRAEGELVQAALGAGLALRSCGLTAIQPLWLRDSLTSLIRAAEGYAQVTLWAVEVASGKDAAAGGER
jgi:hypothetical protein